MRMSGKFILMTGERGYLGAVTTRLLLNNRFAVGRIISISQEGPDIENDGAMAGNTRCVNSLGGVKGGGVDSAESF